MDAKQSIPGLTRTENDAVTAIGAFLIGMFVLLCTVVLGLQFLSVMPPIMVYGILFAITVFAGVCLVAFMRADVPAKHTGPPELKFSNPARKARSSQRSTRAAAQRPVRRLKPLL
jgi:hypothetical protein